MSPASDARGRGAAPGDSASAGEADDSAAIWLRGAAVSYGGPAVVRDVDLTVPAGAIHVLLGESGSGKTTLLRAIAGFEPLMAGTLRLFGTQVDGGGGAPWPPERRRVGVVFQDYALFPHLDVGGNLAFGMATRDQRRIDELLAAVGLSGYRQRPVSALSGGEQQRVALARALAHAPRLILFDEPFSNLNRTLRRTLRRQTADLLRERGITAVFVTHDREEALSLATTLSVMDGGQLLATDTPRALYEAPTSAAVAAALGDCSVVPGARSGERFESVLGAVAVRAEAPADGDAVVIRPEQLTLSRAPDAGVVGTVQRVEYDGSCDRVDVVIGGERVSALAPVGEYAPGEEVGVAIAVERLPLVRRDDSAR